MCQGCVCLSQNQAAVGCQMFLCLGSIALPWVLLLPLTLRTCMRVVVLGVGVSETHLCILMAPASAVVLEQCECN